MFGLNFGRDGGSANGAQPLSDGEKHHNLTYGITPVNPVVLTTGKEFKVPIPGIGKMVKIGPYKNTGDHKKKVGGRQIYIKVVSLLVDARFRRCPSCKIPFFDNTRQIGYKKVVCAKCGLTVQGTPNYVR